MTPFTDEQLKKISEFEELNGGVIDASHSPPFSFIIFVDGVERRQVTELNRSKGEVTFCELDEHGNLVVDWEKEEPVKKTITGKIELYNYRD